MSRPLRTPDEIAAKKEHILTEALKVLGEDGFSNMSINRVAGQIGMTAANLYNYFASRDELLLAMQTRISEDIYRSCQAVYEKESDPLDRLSSFLRILIDMGLFSMHHYDILYSLTAPRGDDYTGTAVERVAREEKEKAHQIALKIRAIHMKVAMEISEIHGTFQPEEASFLLNRMWCLIHGAITLHNRNFLQRFGESDDEMFAKICDDAMEPFRPKAAC
ncbi:TetR/AcrR family transcriptional regulator [bacterium]|nr:TetR/AcrR family transcriptional regulator [bacterium]